MADRIKMGLVGMWWYVRSPHERLPRVVVERIESL